MLFLTGWFFNLIGSFVNNKIIKRIIGLIGILILAWLAGTVSVDHSADTAAYMRTFSMNPSTSIFESGYLNLSYWFYTNGFDYTTFRTVTFFVFYILFYISVNALSNNPNFFILIYSFFPFLSDATQVRNFFMLTFVLMACAVLTKRTFSRYLLAIALIYVASLFHSTGSIFYLFVLLRAIHFRKIYIIIPKLIYIITAAGVLLWATGSISLLSQYIGSLSFFSERNGISESLQTYSAGIFNVYTIPMVASYLFMLHVLQIIIKDKMDDSTLTEKDESLYLLFLIGAIGIPVIFSSFAFERILRNSMMCGIILVTSTTTIKNLKKGDGVKYILFSLSIILGIIAEGYLYDIPGMMGSYTFYILKFIQ
ncbi:MULTISPECIES: EpsG family protein [Leuconostoc]|nr:MULTISPECIES: EpsG family protein [Leuconostoc]AKP35610.1 hypothetical protein NH16_00805 [Leuconostoc mesenteroides subsp. dextranicum]MBM7435533.1 hypothetical protein [Leuconostoc rapi]QUY16414.1 hypothetical protein GWG51_06305 [Leuconostoc mesenteroides]WPK14377.1 EpsG family protein [Leuconostoc mesenteroides]GEL83358.1 hypothetical protein LME02_13870 [Leuconostoc mesenteroides subsp. dextranicum]